MYRGTTPTLTFFIDFSTENITKLNIAFSQKNVVVLDKNENDIEFEEVEATETTEAQHKIKLDLSQDDTLKLDDTMVAIQLRIRCQNLAMASKIITVPVNAILKDGVL